MGYFEAEKGKVGFYPDTVWAKLGFDRSTTSYRNPIAGLQIRTSSNTALTNSFAIIEAGGLYEIARWPGSPGSFTALDGLLGFRYWNMRIDVNFDFNATLDFTASATRWAATSSSAAASRSPAPAASTGSIR